MDVVTHTQSALQAAQRQDKPLPVKVDAPRPPEARRPQIEADETHADDDLYGNLAHTD